MTKALKYCIQKHAASHLHYDFRLQKGNVLLSWAIPKKPSLSTRVKRLAIQVKNHKLSYGNFEGVIEKGYGAGIVMLWDWGTYRHETKNKQGKKISLTQALKNGKIDFSIKGEKLNGRFSLIHYKEKQWLLIKQKDEYANKKVPEATRSCKTNRTIKEIEKDAKNHG